MRGTILYEDERSADARNFGPHELLIACLIDDTGMTREELKKILHPVPRKGDGKLKKELNINGLRLLDAGVLCAVFDHDKSRKCFSLPAQACKSELLLSIRQCIPSKTFDVILLENNVEDLILACCQIDGKPAPTTKPSPLERDKYCDSVAWSDKIKRDQLRSSMPSFDRLVRVAKQMVDKIVSE